MSIESISTIMGSIVAVMVGGIQINETLKKSQRKRLNNIFDAILLIFSFGFVAWIIT